MKKLETINSEVRGALPEPSVKAEKPKKVESKDSFIERLENTNSVVDFYGFKEKIIEKLRGAQGGN